METVIPGLLASAPQPLPFAPTVWARAFLLERERGNLLIYSVGELEAMQLQAIGQSSRISHQYLNHHHEAEFAPDGLIGPLVVHEEAREPVAAKAPVEAAYTERHMLDDDFEVIPAPGHTNGSTCFLSRSENGRALFTKRHDLPQQRRVGRGRAQVERPCQLHRESGADPRARLRPARTPGMQRPGQPYHAVTDRSDARRRIEAILKRVTHGQDR